VRALSLVVNGKAVAVDAAGDETLLTVLRDRLRLTGTKEGCSEGECGACTVLVDGVPVDSCIFAAHAAAGAEVTTIEGLSRDDGRLGPVQQAFVDHFSVQCGFCTPGFVVTLTALLAEEGAPDEAAIRSALSGNLCRCTGYASIVDAALAAAEQVTR
jgi:carbon-monoxide dehydrogenase small subunit